MIQLFGRVRLHTCSGKVVRLTRRNLQRSVHQVKVRAGQSGIGKSDRNRDVASLVKELVGVDNKESYKELQDQTSRFRAGEISAADLHQCFVRLTGGGRPTQQLVSAIASLLPPGRRQAFLLAAAAVSPGVGQGEDPDAGDDPNTWTRVKVDPVKVENQLNQAAAAASASGGDPQDNTAGGRASRMAGKQKGTPPPGLDGDRRVKQKGELAGPQANKGQGVLLWLRMDLRIHDQPTLDAAARRASQLGGKLAICFVHSVEEDGNELNATSGWRPTGASLVWQEAALRGLDADLQTRYGPGAAIIFRKGPYLPALKSIAEALDVGAVYYSRRHEPQMRATDESVEAGLQARGLEVHNLNSTLLQEPEGVRINMSSWSGHFGTLTPFSRACQKLAKKGGGKPIPPPQKLPVAKQSPGKDAGGEPLEALGMVELPVRQDGTPVHWEAPLLEAWNMSESAAQATLDEFASVGLAKYEAFRNLADATAVSKLSPYVHFGQVSARQVLAVVEAHGGKQASKTFWRRLVWRDLAYWQLHHWPEMATKPIRESYEGQEWREDPAALEAWQKGTTGFPLVDAGMRQLWLSGWMQQSVRMVCAAFLTEYLNIHWVHGCRWFHECLVDADLAINSMMWQNAGKCGLDQWNFTLLPTSTSQDPGGDYVARWVPEVAKLPKKYRHQPWKAPTEAQEKAGLVLGTTYPHRITGDAVLQELRKKNEKAIKRQRKAVEGEWTDNGGYDLITVPEGATTDRDGQKIRVFTKRDYRNLADV